MEKVKLNKKQKSVLMACNERNIEYIEECYIDGVLELEEMVDCIIVLRNEQKANIAKYKKAGNVKQRK